MADTNITETNVDYEPSVDIQDANDEIWFDIINRTITPKEGQDLKDVLVQNDANSRNFGFMIQRYFEDDDLSTKNIRVHYVNSLNQHDISAVHSINIVGTNSDVLSFMWLVGNKVCVETGNVQFAIEFYDDDGYELYTKPTMVKIEQGIYTVGEIPEPDDWYKLFKKELLDIQNNIDAKNITTKINLWELQSGVYTVSPNIDLCYAEATESDSELCYHTRTASVLYVSEYTMSTQGAPINYKSFSILTKDLVSGEIVQGTPKHMLFITGTFTAESHTTSLSKYYFKEKYNLNNWLQLGDGLRSVSPDLIGYTLSENEIADNSIKISLDNGYVNNLIQTYTDSEMSDTSENPVQNKIAKAYTDEKTKAIPTDITLTDTLLQLTEKSAPVGEGVHIDREIRANLLFNKLNGVKVEGSPVLTAPVVYKEINAPTWGFVTIETKLLHSVNHTDSGTLIVVPVLSGMPTILYDSDSNGDIQNRYFPDTETVSVRFFAQMDGEDFIVDETLFKELCAESGGVFSKSLGFYLADTTKNILTHTLKLEFKGDNAADTVTELYASLQDILATVDKIQICTSKHIVTEMESEVIYNA